MATTTRIDVKITSLPWGVEKRILSDSPDFKMITGLTCEGAPGAPVEMKLAYEKDH